MVVSTHWPFSTAQRLAPAPATNYETAVTSRSSSIWHQCAETCDLNNIMDVDVYYIISYHIEVGLITQNKTATMAAALSSLRGRQGFPLLICSVVSCQRKIAAVEELYQYTAKRVPEIRIILWCSHQDVCKQTLHVQH